MSAKPDTVVEELVTVNIDGVDYKARKNAMIIEVTDGHDISVPRFCYHKKLPIAANCRMCMVQVEMGGRMAPKPIPACATPVADGMKIWTTSDYAKKAQRAVMEFLLINHPLDCPICDQGGECELQDVALEYGRGISRFTEKKRVVKDKNFGSLIATDMTRCIHCTRCIRFLEHIGGSKELGGTGRGETMEISTYIENSIDSELSGNIIDICPVGALTSKPFRFTARAWELIQTASISPHDCVGSNMLLHTRNGKLMRVVPNENEGINEVWLSDRDRFSYQGVNSDDRLTQPMVKTNGEWQTVGWEEALETVAKGLKAVNLENLGFLASPNATVEEHYLLNRIAEGLGTANIDHRLRRIDFTGQEQEPLFPALAQSIASLEDADAVLIVGANPRKDQPIIGLRLRQAAEKGAKIMTVHSVDYPVTYTVTEKLITRPGEWVQQLAAIAAAVLKNKNIKAPALLASVLQAADADSTATSIAEHLIQADNAVLLLGISASMHPSFSALRALAVCIAENTQASIGFLSDGANAAGAHLAGVLPHRTIAGQSRATVGANTKDMLSTPQEAYLTFGIEPEYDCIDSRMAMHAMQKANFVVSLTSFVTASMREYVDVLLPIAAFSETSGTYVNCEGNWQSFSAVSRAPGDARPGWKVLRVLGNVLELDGFEQTSSEMVREELRGQLDTQVTENKRYPDAIHIEIAQQGIERVAELPIYATDAVVRRADALLQTPDAKVACIRLNPDDAAQLGLSDTERAGVKQGGVQTIIPLQKDSRVAKGAVVLPVSLAISLVIPEPWGTLTMEKV
jgi:NADH-quinone oxidoreductase subunit G